MKDIAAREIWYNSLYASYSSTTDSDTDTFDEETGQRLDHRAHQSRSFENSYIPENPRTPKPLTFSKNRLRGAKNRSNISPVAKKNFRKNDFFFSKNLHTCKKNFCAYVHKVGSNRKSLYCRKVTGINFDAYEWKVSEIDRRRSISNIQQSITEYVEDIREKNGKTTKHHNQPSYRTKRTKATKPKKNINNSAPMGTKTQQQRPTKPSQAKDAYIVCKTPKKPKQNSN
ncbi:hypothetical protein LXL04_004163 [Taraxacum kok-saghyz]